MMLTALAPAAFCACRYAVRSHSIHWSDVLPTLAVASADAPAVGRVFQVTVSSSHDPGSLTPNAPIVIADDVLLSLPNNRSTAELIVLAPLMSNFNRTCR